MMSVIRRRWIPFFWGWLLVAPGGIHGQPYTLLVEPSYPQDMAAEVYRPLLDYLRAETGVEFRLKAPSDHLIYWRDLRNNEPVDFVFEYAHFTDYRNRRFGFVPLVKTGEPVRFVLLVPRENEGTGLDDLVGRPIATLPAPSLGFLVLRDMFPDPIARPQILASLTSWQDGPSLIFSGEAAATLVPANLAQELQNLVEVAHSRDFPGTALSASPTVPVELRERIIAAMLALHEKAVEDPAVYAVLHELRVTRFVPASASEYRGWERLLARFHGYQPP
ncbi:MAG: hypothetical protein KatS3mg125_1554 [Lysobacterales bacterium]|nr:MAG: hypothetical protein KatS3mg125_1554 [Xanthomonadales bacterium]